MLRSFSLKIFTAKHFDLTLGSTTVCPESSDPFYMVSYYIRWVTTSWTYSTNSEINGRTENLLKNLIEL